jgi:serine/threonine-protein kinase RsbW
MLALQEACTNVVRHAYPPPGPPGTIGVKARLTRHLLRFTVTDEGPGYDPATVPPPDFSRPQEGGYGLHLMRKTMSRVTYRRAKGHNELILDKALHEPDGAGA